MRYQIVRTMDLTELIAQVELLLNTGWRPAGGLAMTYEVMGDGTVVSVFGQALVHDAPPA